MAQKARFESTTIVPTLIYQDFSGIFPRKSPSSRLSLSPPHPRRDFRGFSPKNPQTLSRPRLRLIPSGFLENFGESPKIPILLLCSRRLEVSNKVLYNFLAQRVSKLQGLKVNASQMFTDMLLLLALRSPMNSYCVYSCGDTCCVDSQNGTDGQMDRYTQGLRDVSVEI